MRTLVLSVAVLALAACPPAPPDTGDTDTDADTDTDTDSDTDADTDSDTDADTDADGCPVPAGSFFGQLGSADNITSTAYTNDGGLDDVIAAKPAEGQSATGLSIAVTDVTVASVGYNPSTATEAWSVWVADANGATRTYLQDSAVKIPLPIAPGEVISFTVTDLENYGGELEITGITAFSKSTSTTDVYVKDVTAADITLGTHAQSLIHGYGELTTEPATCGGSSVCTDMVTSNGQTVPFRIKSIFEPQVGDCIEFYMPVGTFSGAPQLNVDNFDWVELY